MDESIEERVVSLLAMELNVLREELTPNKTLVRHLHMEGDQLGHFFAEFEKEFSVDFKLLYEDWYCYFVYENLSERSALNTALLLMFPGLLLAVLLLRLFPDMTKWVGAVLALALWIALLILRTRWRNKVSRATITVQDLVDCAKAGKWAKEVPEPVKLKFAKYGPYQGRSLAS
jgi:hypothetical protein